MHAPPHQDCQAGHRVGRATAKRAPAPGELPAGAGWTHRPRMQEAPAGQTTLHRPQLCESSRMWTQWREQRTSSKAQ